ncbi:MULTISPECIES: GNAT family N-acetyltransferase [unclassified Oceanobacter]|uniref:GNAT family N-acetyltransferase n=1 Tax=unclassified Oceanobacter TaxID=2620260 RepID=UPI0027337832|nr:MULTISPECIES: GNAT family N-acyltransferase [unclassified Oceanobacter]MDP2506458.1 GNAT family N-acyltransferase [Oceanobacter sp. 3_MG-2023]MDP2609167.1 GNAT family N-acyltransferase [Oceanobacter sp. 1_MG-2023]MDP2612541.1 GNAT family N-acyltransferase [Oceanobacter sp. 2_MG-2023]
MQQATASQIAISSDSPLVARVTQDPAEIRQALALRYRVFAEGMGANIDSGEAGIDRDHFDDICLHLIVKDVNNDRVVGYSRILTNELAEQAGGFYSATEFDLSNIVKPGYRYMEIGRTCVDPDFRSGAVIGLLWSGIAQFMSAHQIDYLMGCASISLNDGYARAIAIINYLRDKHFSAADARAEPRVHMPSIDVEMDGARLVPPLLKAYLRIGVKVCGEPCLDKDFNVADALILLSRDNINQRYLRHFTKTDGQS